MGDIVAAVPYQLQNRLRLQLLQSLLLLPPSDWRLRRIDCYSPMNLDVFGQSTSVDFRIMRKDIENALDIVRASCGATGERKAIARTAAAYRAARDTGSCAWQQVDALLPLLWVHGPLNQLSLTVDDEPAVPLTRYQTAHVVAACLDNAYTEFTPLDWELPSTIFELVWVLTSTDVAAVSDSLHRGLRRGAMGAGEIVHWAADVLSGIGFDAHEQLAQPFLITQVEQITKRAEELLRDEYGRGVPPIERYSPFWNPLLSIRAFFLKRSSWDRKGATPLMNKPDVVWPLLVDFMQMCQSHLLLLDWLKTGDGSENPDRQLLSDFLVGALTQVTWYWPLIVRRNIEVDATHRSVVTLTAHFKDRVSRNRQRYPLTAGDAMSHHVEVSSPHAELRLRANGGRVEFPARRYYVTWLNRQSVSRSPAARLFPRYSVRAKDYFYRTEEAGAVVHGFYDAPLTSETIPWPETVENPTAGEGPQLVIRYGILDYVWWTNVLVTALLLALSAYLSILALKAGLYPNYRARLPFGALIKPLAAIYFGVVLLFTIERHNSPIVADRLRWPWRLTVLASVLAGLATVAWVSTESQDAIPFGLAPTINAAVVAVAKTLVGCRDWLAYQLATLWPD